MDRVRRQGGGSGGGEVVQRSPAPGKRTLTDGLAGRAVQKKEAQPQQAVTHSQQMSDGPYGWASSYDIEVFADKVVVTIGANLVPDADVDAAEIKKIKAETALEFSRYFDRRFNLCDASGKARPLHVRLDYAHASPHVDIAVHAGGGRDNRRNWFVDSDPIDRAHEVGHQLGLKDEYVDATVPDRAAAGSPGVFTDHSIMGDYPTEGARGADVRQRHGDQLATAISGTTGQQFTAERSSTYIVRKGDTLSWIAQRILGDAARWPEIHALNKDKVADPNLILPGWELKLP